MLVNHYFINLRGLLTINKIFNVGIICPEITEDISQFIESHSYVQLPKAYLTELKYFSCTANLPVSPVSTARTERRELVRLG